MACSVMRFYVPANVEVDDISFVNLGKAHGGFTELQGSGTWIDRNGGAVTEDVNVIEVVTELGINTAETQAEHACRMYLQHNRSEQAVLALVIGRKGVRRIYLTQKD